MQRQGVLEFARVLGLGPPSRTSTAIWVHYRCPFAQWTHDGHRSKPHHFNVSVSTDKHSIYRCWSCHKTGALPQLAYELGRYRKQDLTHIGKQIEEQELLGPKIVLAKWDDELPEDFHENATLHQVSWPDPKREFEFPSAAGHPYLRDRGIGVATAIRLGVRYDAGQRRVLFPVYNRWGRFAGFTGRRIDPAPFVDADGDELELDGKPYLKVRDYFGLSKRSFFLGEFSTGSTKYNTRRARPTRRSRPTSGDRITLVEGIFDYAYLSELAIEFPRAILGSTLTPEKVIKLVELDLPVVLFMDNDKAGYDCVQICKENLFGKIPLLSVEYPEGYEGADPGSLPPDVVKNMCKKAELITRIA